MDSQGRMEVVRELCSFEGRLAGTDAERRAANRMAERLRESGRRVEVEPTYVHPQSGLVHALHCLIGFAGSLVAVAIPALGFALVLLAATSMYLDLNYRVYLFRSLFFRRASQNVVARGKNPRRRQRLLITAHLDSARTGAVFSPRRARRFARLQARTRLPLGPFRFLFWSLALLVPMLGARMAGIESDALSLLQLLPTLALLVGIFALVDIELSPVVPGASDNATGVAAALSLAEELAADPAKHLDVWVVLTGAGECQQEGMRSFLRAHRGELEPQNTAVIELNTLGRGDVRYESSAGWVVSAAMDARLVELAGAIAEADREGREPRFRAASLRSGSAGDSMPARLRGFRAIGITTRDLQGLAPHLHLRSDTPENVDPGAMDRAHDFALELIRALDRDLGRRRRPRSRAKLPALAATASA